MTRGCSRWLTLALLAAWVLLGPVGMAFDTCAAMMALCDGGPCGVVAAVVDAASSFAAPALLAVTPSTVAEHLATVLRPLLEPPPKPLRLSA